MRPGPRRRPSPVISSQSPLAASASPRSDWFSAGDRREPHRTVVIACRAPRTPAPGARRRRPRLLPPSPSYGSPPRRAVVVMPSGLRLGPGAWIRSSARPRWPGCARRRSTSSSSAAATRNGLCARRRLAGAVGGAGGGARLRLGHLEPLDEADPRRAALPRAAGVRARPRGAAASARCCSTCLAPHLVRPVPFLYPLTRARVGARLRRRRDAALRRAGRHGQGGCATAT